MLIDNFDGIELEIGNTSTHFPSLQLEQPTIFILVVKDAVCKIHVKCLLLSSWRDFHCQRHTQIDSLKELSTPYD